MATHVLDSVLDTLTATSKEATVFDGVTLPNPPVERPFAGAPREASDRPVDVVRSGARRRIPPVSGHALEKLGHAIEYLTDEYIHEGCSGGLWNSRVGAIQLLMSLNREVYYECPIIEPVWTRMLHSLKHVFSPEEFRPHL